MLPLADEVRALYDADFYLHGESVVYWDQFYDLKVPLLNGKGQTMNFPLLAPLR